MTNVNIPGLGQNANKGVHIRLICEVLSKVYRVKRRRVSTYLDWARTPMTSAYRSATMLTLAALGFGALLIDIYRQTQTDTERYRS